MIDDERIDLSGDFGLAPEEIEEMFNRAEALDEMFSGDSDFGPDGSLNPEAAGFFRELLGIGTPRSETALVNPARHKQAEEAIGRLKALFSCVCGGSGEDLETEIIKDSIYTGKRNWTMNVVTPADKLNFSRGDLLEMLDVLKSSNGQILILPRTDSRLLIEITFENVYTLLDTDRQ